MKITLLYFILFLSFSIIYSLDYTIPPNTYSIQSGDFDNDGDNDIVAGHNYEWGCISFLENYGNGEFVLIDTMHSFGSITVHKPCDIDNEAGEEIIINYQDGFEGSKQILIFYNFDLENPFYYDSEDFIPFGNFAPGDFDNDGDYDLVFSSSGAGLDNLWGLMYNLGNREFSEPDWFECPSQALNADFEKFECNDLDNNDYDDIIAFSFADTYIYYFSEDGFTVDSLDYQVTSSGMTSADFDNDEDYDIVITHWPIMTQDNFKIYENLGNQDFTLHNYYRETLWSKPISCKLNNDNLTDIVTVGDEIKKYFNEGNLQFSEVYIQDYPDYGESWVKSSFSDFDGNGTQDVAIIRYGIEENNLTILYNDGDGNFGEEPVSADNHQLPITNYQLRNYPNPFNPTTTISFSIPEESKVEFTVYNIKGQKVKVLTNNNYDKGSHSVSWDGVDESGKSVSSGVYFYNLKVNGKDKAVKKMLLLK